MRKVWLYGRELIPGLIIFGLFYMAFIQATN